ncbi:MAG TPA: hypothetical protein VEM14_01510 [Gemmatimonadaceae bacterium]|nr:hypothetical protein [Gemmatimonadaceae bacterium]
MSGPVDWRGQRTGPANLHFGRGGGQRMGAFAMVMACMQAEPKR